MIVDRILPASGVRMCFVVVVGVVVGMVGAVVVVGVAFEDMIVVVLSTAIFQ